MPGDKPQTDWLPSASPEALQQRANLLALIRDYFHRQGVTEVETPLMSRAGNSDPGIRQFALKEQDLWLRTSPEYAMKRLLAAGSGDIFELGRVFRAAEQGRHHNAEFTMLEWYRVGWTYFELMDEVSSLVRQCLPDLALDESRVTYRDLLMAYAGVDPMDDPDGAIRDQVAASGFDVPGLDRQGLLDLLITHAVQPNLPENALTFVYDFPLEQAALARIRKDTPPVAERFELFLGKLELANGYQELCDPIEQRRRFEQENALREAGSEPGIPLDERLLAALESGMPDCAGVALGLDRLLMRVCGATSLEEVLAFPSDRA